MGSRRIASRAARGVLTLFVAFAVMLGISSQPASAMTVTQYGKAASYPFANSSTAQANWNADPLGYYKRSCASYTAWRVLHSNHVKLNRAGSASNWKKWAQNHGYKTSSTPRRGAVAWWSRGHVAWVEKVFYSKGKLTIRVHEYSWNRYYHKDVRDVSKGSNGYPQSFILVPMR